MSLRVRLTAAIAVVSIVLLIVVVVVVERQERFLIDQIDRTLPNASPVLAVEAVDVGAGDADELPPELPSPTADEPLPVLDYYIRWEQPDGQIVEAIGPILEDVPDVSQLRTDNDDPDWYQTVDGVSSSERFRVLVRQQPFGFRIIIATPLTEVDDAVDQLRWSLLGGSAAVVAILLLTVAWVSRLGIRPITRVTAAATAIGRGERDHRVEPFGPRTEAGRLAGAFNEMLDQRDAAEQRLRRFVADASHELRTPLTSINGYLDLVADGTFEEGRRDDIIRRIRSESQRMCDLVEDLLLLAHLDEGRPMRSDPVDIAAVLVDIASDAAVTHPHRRIDLTIGGAKIGDAGAPTLVVTGDDFRLRQVVAGLVQNALVHTPPTAAISLCAEHSGDHTVVSVADTGPGLDAEAASSVFARFSRQDSSRARQSSPGGFGLGLAIARAIVEAHGASISLDTAPGRGCVFTVTFPAR